MYLLLSGVYVMYLHKSYGKKEVTKSRNLTNGSGFIRDRTRQSNFVVPSTFSNSSCALGDHLHLLELTPILTLFTALSQHQTSDPTLLPTGPAYMSFLQPVPFILSRDNPIWIRAALDQGWKIERSVRTRSGIPVLKDMFKDVANKRRSTFLGFSNADDLFGVSLIRTLLQLSCFNYGVIHNITSLVVSR